MLRLLYQIFYCRLKTRLKYLIASTRLCDVRVQVWVVGYGDNIDPHNLLSTFSFQVDAGLWPTEDNAGNKSKAKLKCIRIGEIISLKINHHQLNWHNLVWMRNLQWLNSSRDIQIYNVVFGTTIFVFIQAIVFQFNVMANLWNRLLVNILFSRQLLNFDIFPICCCSQSCQWTTFQHVDVCHFYDTSQWPYSLPTSPCLIEVKQHFWYLITLNIA